MLCRQGNLTFSHHRYIFYSIYFHTYQATTLSELTFNTVITVHLKVSRLKKAVTHHFTMFAIFTSNV